MDRGSILGRVIPKTQKKWYLMLTLYYKVRIKGGEVIQGMEWCSLLHVRVVAIERGAFGSPSTKVANFIVKKFPEVSLKKISELLKPEEKINFEQLKSKLSGVGKANSVWRNNSKIIMN